MSTDQELRAIFRSLKKRQIYYLFYKRAQDLKNEDIAIKLGITEKTLETHVHKIYVFFDIQTGRGDSDRMWEDLIRKVGVYIDALTESDVENWRPTPRPKKASAPPPPQANGLFDDIPKNPGQALRDLWHQHWRGFLLLGILLVGSGFVIWNISHRLFVPAIPLPSSTPGPTRTPVGITMPTSNVTLQPTTTPSALPYTSPTPEPTLTPDPSILFFDNFNNGISPGWQVLLGEPITIDGHLPPPPNGTLLMVVGDKNWRRIKIEFDFSSSNPNDYSEVCVRFVDIKNGMYFSVSGSDVGWYMLKDGIKTNIAKASISNPRGPWPWTLVIDGSNYSAFLDFPATSSINTSVFKSGRVGIKMFQDSSGTIDNFKVSQLP